MKLLQRAAGKTYTLGARCFHLSVKFARTVRQYGAGYALRRTAEKVLFSRARDKRMNREYPLWIRGNEPTPEGLNKLRESNKAWTTQPRISILTPVFDPKPAHLSACLDSVKNQVYENWEHCLADGGSKAPEIRAILEDFQKIDSRFKVTFVKENAGISGNSMAAYAQASGDYVALLDHDDTLAPFALDAVARVLATDPEIDLLYSDEDKLAFGSDKRLDPHFKPDWAPDTLLSYNYVCHFLVVRRELFEKAGGLRRATDGAQDFDLVLRASRKARRIHHLPQILYHWRMTEVSTAFSGAAKPYVFKAGQKAIEEHLAAIGREGTVIAGSLPGIYRVQYAIKDSPLVSIVIPTKDKASLLEKCVTSIVNKTAYTNYEILVVDNNSEEERTRTYFAEIGRNPKIRVVRYDKPFNFSALNNFATREARGEHLFFLNNDTEIITPEWLGEMLSFSQRDDVGAVGAKLYYPDHTTQHAGVIVGIGGVAGHSHKNAPRTDEGYMARLAVVQNMSAVTAACLLMRRKVFEEIGGFDETLPVAFNDIDFCLRIRRQGYLIVFTPYAELYHHESRTRGYEVTPEKLARLKTEIQFMRNRWGAVLERDPYYSPHLTMESEDFSLRLPAEAAGSPKDGASGGNA